MTSTYYVIYIDFEKAYTFHHRMSAEIMFDKVVEEKPWSIIELDEFMPGHGSASLKRHEIEDSWSWIGD